MLRYSLVALALKVFSLNNLSKKTYRKVGNVIGNRRRKKMNIDTYMRRGNLLNRLCKKYGVINEGNQLLEIGTGWIHWYSIFLCLFYNVKITMLDIWDNRQFGAFKATFSKLSEISKDSKKQNKLVVDIDKIVSVNCFEELYDILDLRYVIEERGSLNKFRTNSFDLIFSFHVLEHIFQKNIQNVVMDIYRILKPGGHTIHQIGIDDHLRHYDKDESPKNYLRYSDRMWKMLFENEVQYFNRLQMSDFLHLFDNQGFLFMEKIVESCNIDSLRISSKYRHHSKDDLACTGLTLVYAKPK